MIIAKKKREQKQEQKNTKSIGENWHISSKTTNEIIEREKEDLREGRTLSPDAAVETDDGGGSEMLPLAINVAHQMIINIRLPRHFLSLDFSLFWLVGFSLSFLLSRLCLFGRELYRAERNMEMDLNAQKVRESDFVIDALPTVRSA